MADTAKPEEPPKPQEPAGEVDTRLEKMQRLMNASFPQQPGTQASANTATATQQVAVEERRQQGSDYGR